MKKKIHIYQDKNHQPLYIRVVDGWESKFLNVGDLLLALYTLIFDIAPTFMQQSTTWHLPRTKEKTP